MKTLWIVVIRYIATAVHMNRDDHIGLKLKSYNFSRKLGEGAWAKVYEVYDDMTHTSCACKVIPKRLMEETPKLKELVQTEIQVLKRCHSENVIKYIDSFNTDKNVYIFTEFCNGGDMEQYLEKKGFLPEDQAREFLKQILNGFKGLHEVDAMHRDFKTANILLHNGVAKIADLGFAKIAKSLTTTILGTSVTMAPELLENKKYGPECDIWSVGVVYYQFLTGSYPYNAINDMEILKKIKKGPPNFPATINISADSKDFINKCLTVDPKQRISWVAIYNHPLLVDKKNNVRQTYIGALSSHISIGKNKDFYDKRKQPVAIELSDLGFQFQKANLEQSANMEQLNIEMAKKKEIEAAIFKYSSLYLERRNKIMLSMKYGIIPIFEGVNQLPIRHSLYAFLICKKAYLAMRDFNEKIKNRNNMFGISIYLAEFGASKEYNNIEKQVESDFEMIEAYAMTMLLDVETSNRDIEAELDLSKATPKFDKLLKENMESYSFQLYQERNIPTVNKTTLIKLIAFVTDLVEGNIDKVGSEEYDRRMENLNVREMEKRFDSKLKQLFSVN